jgi:hypothetical protein
MAIEHAIPAIGSSKSTPGFLSTSLQQWPLFDDEHLFIQAQNISPTTDAVVRFQVRAWSDVKRGYVTQAQDLTVPFNSAASKVVIMDRGAIFTARIFVTQGSTLYGDVYVRVAILRGFDQTFVGTGQMLQGYISTDSHLSWPGSPIQTLHEGRGVPRVWPFVNNTTNASLSLFANRRWRVINATVVFTSSGVGPNRLMLGEIFRGGTLVFQSAAAAVQPPGTVWTYSFAPGASEGVAPLGALSIIPFPVDCDLLGSADAIRFDAGPGGPGDVFNTGSANVREWFEPCP